LTADRKGVKKGMNGKKNLSYLLVPVILYGAVINYFLYDDLGDMRLPVIIYTFVGW
jgi:uncharacterized membrane protein YhhN